MSKEKFDKFHNIQQQLNKSKNTKIENEKKRASDYYKDRTCLLYTSPSPRDRG